MDSTRTEPSPAFTEYQEKVAKLDAWRNQARAQEEARHRLALAGLDNQYERTFAAISVEYAEKVRLAWQSH